MSKLVEINACSECGPFCDKYTGKCTNPNRLEAHKNDIMPDAGIDAHCPLTDLVGLHNKHEARK